MVYVDRFVAAVPAANSEAYLVLAQATAKVFKDTGATRVVDCWADDVPAGEVTSMPMAVKCKDDEVVAFAWIEWPSKEAAMNFMKDPEYKPHLEARTAGSESFHFVIEGKDDLA